MDSLKSKDFTIEKGIEVQQQQLAEWKPKLNTKSFKLVSDKCTHENETRNLKTGYDVFRGSSITTFIQNLYR